MVFFKLPTPSKRCVCGRTFTGPRPWCPICCTYRDFDERVHASYAAGGFVDRGYGGAGAPAIEREARPDCAEPSCDNPVERNASGEWSPYCSRICGGMARRGKVVINRPACTRPGCSNPAQKLRDPTRWGDRCSVCCQREQGHQPVRVEEVPIVSASTLPKCGKPDCENPVRVHPVNKRVGRFCSKQCGKWVSNHMGRTPRPQRPAPTFDDTPAPAARASKHVALPPIEDQLAQPLAMLAEIARSLPVMPAVDSVSLTVTVSRDGLVTMAAPVFSGTRSE